MQGIDADSIVGIAILPRARHIGIVDGQHLQNALVGLVYPVHHLLKVTKVTHAKRALTTQREDRYHGTCTLPRIYREVRLRQFIDDNLIVSDIWQDNRTVSALLPERLVNTQQYKLKLDSLRQCSSIQADNPLMILMLKHGLCLVDIPVTKGITATDNTQLLTNTELRSTYLQAYSAQVLCSSAELTLVDHDTVCQCRAIHISILRNVYPVVIHRIAGALLSGKFQTMWFHKPFMAHLFVATHQAIIIVNVRAGLCHFRNLYKPVLTVECRHLVLRHLSTILCRPYVQHQIFTKGSLVFNIK